MSAAPAPLRWQIPQVPAHWQVVPGWGVRGVAEHAAGSNICLTEDVLLAGKLLQPYVQVQIRLMRRNFAEPQFAGPSPTELLAAAEVEEGSLLLIRHAPAAGRELVQLQVYARIQTWIGIATLTTVKQNVGALRKDFEMFLAALRVSPAGGAN